MRTDPAVRYGGGTAAAPAFGALVLSLDFELHWGVRDRHEPEGAVGERLHGARAAVPSMLALFEEFEVAATWATVGFLFADFREQLERFSPTLRPAYADPALDPYREVLGDGEADDPLHFAPSLIDRIRRTPRQEIATHTFSHFCCGEPGPDRPAFRADLEAARDIARSRGIRLRSVVFPRNQRNPDYDDILRSVGFCAYRGTPPTGAWSFETHREAERPSKRARRLLDAYVGGRSHAASWDEILQPSGLSDVRASAMLRPYHPRLRHLDGLRRARIRRALRRAAWGHRVLHLWWHPHNFGTHLHENLDFLRGVLEDFARLRADAGMRSLTMGEVDLEARRCGSPETSGRVAGTGAA